MNKLPKYVKTFSIKEVLIKTKSLKYSTNKQNNMKISELNSRIYDQNIDLFGGESSAAETVGHAIAKALYEMGQCKNIEIIDINKLNQDVEAFAKAARISTERAKDLIIIVAEINIQKLRTIDLSKIDLPICFPVEKRSKKNRNRKKWESPYKYHR